MEQIKAPIFLEAVLVIEIYNVRAPIQLERDSQPQHLKRLFFLKNRHPF